MLGAFLVKRGAGWRCEKCGCQCRKPREESTRRPLLVAHLDFDSTNCDPANLVALCLVCHHQRLIDYNRLKNRALARVERQSVLSGQKPWSRRTANLLLMPPRVEKESPPPDRA